MSDNTNAQIQINLAIDFGSTNTVMAWKVYDILAGGKKVRSKKFTDTDANEDGISIKRIPSVMIFKNENPNNAVVPQDLYGEDARNAIRMSNISPKVCDNFKQYLYTCPPDSDDYRRGVELTTKFFEYLRRLYMNSIYNRMPPDTTVAVDLYLSTPVRAHPTHRTLMREIATAAGFTPEIGIREINTNYDEARCVVQYAMAHKKDDIQGLLSLDRQKATTILFVDVGGSTTDMNLVRLSISSDGDIALDPFSSWPNADVKYPLGGCLVDEAIRDYLINEGFADKKYTLDWWEHRDGKDRFRVFKEQNNLSLSQGECVEKLGNVKDACYDSDDEDNDFEPRKYKNSPRRINEKIFREEICAKYTTEMRNALKAIFNDQRSVSGKPPVRPEDVDGILLSGAGSLLYFIRNVFLEKEMGFTKIQQKQSQLYTWPEPSLCCAEGALVEQTRATAEQTKGEQPQMEYLNYARDNYYVKFEIGYSDDDAPTAATSFLLVKKHQMLPHSVQGEVPFSYTDTGVKMTLRLSLYRVDSSGRQTPVGEPGCWKMSRNMGKTIIDTARGIAGVATILTTMPVAAMNGFISKFSGKTWMEGWDSYCNKLEGVFFPESKANGEISYNCTLSENNQVEFQLKFNSPYHHMDENVFNASL